MEEGNCTEDTPEHSDNVSKEESTTHPNTDNDNHINNGIPVYTLMNENGEKIEIGEAL